MKKLTLLTAAALVVSALGLAVPVLAKDADPAKLGQPRVDQMERRLESQEQRIEQGVEDGTTTPQDAAKETKKLENVENQLETAKKKQIENTTKAQEHQMNKAVQQNGNTTKNPKK
jgi:hypothetical protein